MNKKIHSTQRLLPLKTSDPMRNVQLLVMRLEKKISKRAKRLLIFGLPLNTFASC